MSLTGEGILAAVRSLSICLALDRLSGSYQSLLHNLPTISVGEIHHRHT
jgi:hypothetical protein